MTLKVLQKAREDILLGIMFYNQQEEGLGNYFYDVLISDIESLQIYAGIHPKIKTFYRALSKRFPYSIYYKIDDDLIKVYAVLDNRRDPKSMESRLKEKI
ncbi:MAG: type II toxin-antitoxin system RelE/ParE family toxin [Sulfurovum sp.]|nr:MAG: type II toxin-antitoxin system RelE/ParE family toxin [Sulfurovum sp.]RUM75467.1 MAG: type II toxin-antitoxin system RelE/ParE family toxin [Sulfurovum sp.]